ncbi:hypothetical protein G3N59_29680 [Paraburkholderia sp. Ac-20340]|uniref:hypothetical protein n=1 Tax=Paraburkholderia sp. Ac-20340 TaxID=2703888 RepID=UPI00197EB2AC|nr:hypothetical protein [Paraburkholderia sp. Ac-20340]MBN3857565.1 hypothetical protein [Paraburkholderia sp. Ac-20340]
MVSLNLDPSISGGQFQSTDDVSGTGGQDSALMKELAKVLGPELAKALEKDLAELGDGGDGSSGGTGGTGGAGGTGGSGGDGMNAQSASGALAGYMGTNGNQSLDMNDLYKLAEGQSAGGNGQTPSPAVQQAAKFMLQNPDTFKQIETNDVAGADGKSGIQNFQNAAQGNIALDDASGAGGDDGSTGSTGGTSGTGDASGLGDDGSSMNAQSASGALAGYMGTNGNKALDMNDLYKLAQGQSAGGNGQKPSAEVQQAAKFMLQNPDTFKQIETNDVAGADGKSGIENFENAAQGNIATGDSGSTGGTNNAGGTSGTDDASGANAMGTNEAAGALAGYMGTNGNKALNVEDLYKLSQGEAAGGNGQKPSAEVQQAAKTMLANPDTFNKIETHDVAGADGNSGIQNFQNAAQGLV